MTRSRVFPELSNSRPPVLPNETARKLANGLTVLAVRRSTVPLVEMRLRIGLAEADPAQIAALAATLLSGTGTASSRDITVWLQRVAGQLAVSGDLDQLIIRGSTPAAGFEDLLAVLGEVLTSANYPASEVLAQRELLANQTSVITSQAAPAVLSALSRLIYGTHSYADQSPDQQRLRAVTPEQLRALHHDQVVPSNAALILVGDIDPELACESVERLLGGWSGERRGRQRPPIGPLASDLGAIALMNRPGATQSLLRVALSAPGREHRDYPAMRMANLIFGGYFSSRLVGNLREDKGYAYAPKSTILNMRAGSLVVVSVDVAPEVLGGAVAETWRELDRIATSPVSARELDQARQYAMGTLWLNTASNNDIADTLTRLAADGLRFAWVADQLGQLAAITKHQIADAAAHYFERGNSVSLVLGDVSLSEPSLMGVTGVTIARV